MLVDSHCHLDRLDLKPYAGNLSRAIDAARVLGVDHFLCVSINLPDCQKVLAIAEQFNDVHASVGVHPLEKEQHNLSVDSLVELARHPKVVAIGETGLDYFYDKTDRKRQRERFSLHLQAASICKKPVIIHTRNAQKDTLDIMAREADQVTGGVMHCFTESWEMARRAMDMNFYISLSGIITFKNAQTLRQVAQKVPMDRLLIETDSPYLAPVPHRGKPNEPKYIVQVAEYLAKLKGMTVEEFADITRKNYLKLFNIA